MWIYNKLSYVLVSILSKCRRSSHHSQIPVEPVQYLAQSEESLKLWINSFKIFLLTLFFFNWTVGKSFLTIWRSVLPLKISRVNFLSTAIFSDSTLVWADPCVHFVFFLVTFWVVVRLFNLIFGYMRCRVLVKLPQHPSQENLAEHTCMWVTYMMRCQLMFLFMEVPGWWPKHSCHLWKPGCTRMGFSWNLLIGTKSTKNWKRWQANHLEILRFSEMQ